MEMMDFVSENMLVMIPALYVVGMALKYSTVKDKYIPVTLIFAGIIGAIGLGGASVENAIQGILVAGATVLGNQTIKQLKKGEREWK